MRRTSVYLNAALVLMLVPSLFAQAPAAPAAGARGPGGAPAAGGGGQRGPAPPANDAYHNERND